MQYKLSCGSVICLFNSSDYLVSLLESLSKQEVLLDQVVFVNDASSDDTIDRLSLLLHTYKVAREVFIVDLKNNVGVSTAFNIGLSQISVDLLFFTGHDDIWMHNRVARTLDYVKKNQESAFFFSSYQCFGSLTTTINCPTTHAEVMLRFLIGNCIGAITVAIRLDKIDKINIRLNSRFDGAEDYDLWTDIYMAGFLSSPINEILMKYRVSSKQMSRNFDYSSRPVDKFVRSKYLNNMLVGLNDYDINIIIMSIFAPEKALELMAEPSVLGRVEFLILWAASMSEKSKVAIFYNLIYQILSKNVNAFKGLGSNQVA